MDITQGSDIFKLLVLIVLIISFFIFLIQILLFISVLKLRNSIKNLKARIDELDSEYKSTLEQRIKELKNWIEEPFDI